MDAENRSRLLESVPLPDAELAAHILSACPTVDAVAGEIDFPLSHTLLADMVGSSRETVTRSLDELQRDGFVARRGHNYRLLASPDTVAAATRL